MSRTAAGVDRRTLVLLSVVIVLASGTSVVALAVPGQSGFPDRMGTLYGASRWVLVTALVVVGVVLLLTSRGSRPLQVTAAAGAVVATQLVGTGVVAVKHWRPFSGMTGFGHANLGTVRTLAAVLTISALLACAALLGLLRASGAYTRSVRTAHRVVTVSLAVVIAVGVPLAAGAGDAETTDLTSLGAYALLYSVPWALGLALSGWLERPAAWAVHATVGVCALVCLAGGGVVHVANPAAAFIPVMVLAAVVAGHRATAARTAARERLDARERRVVPAPVVRPWRRWWRWRR